MARRLILDTGILVATERSHRDIDRVIEADDDVVIAAVSAAELILGVTMATPRRRSARHRFVQGLFEVLPVVPYDLEVARAHAALLSHVRGSGQPRGAHDLQIAATAIATERTVVTTDRRASFEELPGVHVVYAGDEPKAAT